jgi:alkylation response protein AidB-like acyl-CoA dehydrogenase
MDFKLTKEQSDIRKAAKSFADGEFEPDFISDLEKRCQYPGDLFQKACGLGFIGMAVPEEYGGQGLGHLENTLVFETFCRRDSSMGLALGLCDLGSELILRHGTAAQKERFLPPLCRGESHISPAYMEEGQIPMPLRYQTTAVEKEGGYLIQGAKTFVYHATLTGPMILFCSLDKGSSTHENVTLIFDKGTHGLSLSDLGERVGMRMIPLSDVVLKGLRFPSESLLGGAVEGKGHSDLFLMETNTRAAAVGTGIAHGAFDMALAYAGRRQQFGRKIASFEAIRGKLTDMATRIELSRLLAYEASCCLDDKAGDAGLCYMAKVVAAETALDVSRDALHIFGGYGYMLEYRIERFYRDAGMVDIIGLPGHTSRKMLAGCIVGEI